MARLVFGDDGLLALDGVGRRGETEDEEAMVLASLSGTTKKANA